METKTTPSHKPNLTDILSKSETILTTNYTHFITLSLLFLPLSTSLITPTPLLAAGHLNLNSITFSYVIYILTIYLLSLCAVAAICYSTHHGLSGKQVNNLILPGLPETPWYRRRMLETYTAVKSLTSCCYSTHHGLSGKQVNNLMLPGLPETPWYRRRMLETCTTVKSLTSSFIPVIKTAVMEHSILFLFVGALYLIVAPTWLFAVITILTVTYFHVNWWLALVVAVVESKYGVSALRRSSCLVNGMRSVSLLLFLYFVSFVWTSVWVFSDGLRALSDLGYVLFVMMFGSIWLMSYLRHITIATTVLYNHCKAFHGELVVDQFDDKIRHVVEG